MARGKRRRVPAELTRVARRIEHWRQTRTTRRAMPAPLWTAAVALARNIANRVRTRHRFSSTAVTRGGTLRGLRDPRYAEAQTSVPLRDARRSDSRSVG